MVADGRTEVVVSFRGTDGLDDWPGSLSPPRLPGAIIGTASKFSGRDWSKLRDSSDKLEAWIDNRFLVQYPSAFLATRSTGSGGGSWSLLSLGVP
jgi:hypothetical protein